MPRISIVETKEIIRKLHQKFSYDFGIFALTALRYRIDRTIESHHLGYPDVLMSRLIEDEEFLNEFLYEISVPSTEMFRDPECWKTLKEKLIPTILERGNAHVWFPGVVSGDELFSFLLLLNKTNTRNKLDITATSLTKKSIERITEGEFNNITLEQGLENYYKVFSDYDLKRYISLRNDKYYRDKSIFNKVIFKVNDLLLQPAPDGVHIIFFRNKLINYNRDFQKHLLDYFVERLRPGGFLILGYQENMLKHLAGTQKMHAFNMEERIFIKE